MSYSTEISQTLTNTLNRFVTLNPHQLSGHAGNLDFWLDEIKHCIKINEEYRKRFEAMKTAQIRYVSAKGTLEFSKVCNGYCPICAEGKSAKPPRSVPDTEIKETLRALRDAAYTFLIHCYKTGFIEEVKLREAMDYIGVSIDIRDLNR
jgi:hypothetical protein